MFIVSSVADLFNTPIPKSYTLDYLYVAYHFMYVCIYLFWQMPRNVSHQKLYCECELPQCLLLGSKGPSFVLFVESVLNFILLATCYCRIMQQINCNLQWSKNILNLALTSKIRQQGFKHLLTSVASILVLK